HTLHSTGLRQVPICQRLPKLGHCAAFAWISPSASLWRWWFMDKRACRYLSYGYIEKWDEWVDNVDQKSQQCPHDANCPQLVAWKCIASRFTTEPTTHLLRAPRRMLHRRMASAPVI